MPAFVVVHLSELLTGAGAWKLIWLMLWRGCAFGGWFFAVALVEAIDTSCGIDQLLFSGKEWMASRTDFDVQVTFLGGASLEGLATRAGDRNFNVFWMNSWFHFVTLYRRHHAAFSKRDMIGVRARIVKLTGNQGYFSSKPKSIPFRVDLARQFAESCDSASRCR